METGLFNKLIDTFNDALTPIYTGSIIDWAQENVDIRGAYAVQGRFNINISKYLIQPFMDLQNRNVTQINLIAATQTGKTLISELYLPYIIVNTPGPCLRLHQSDDMAKTAIESRLYPLLINCREVKKLLNEDSITKGSIKLSNMYVKIAGAKENVIHSSTIQYLMMDEVWQYNEGVVEKAKARTTALGNNKKIIISSQPGMEGDQLDKEHTGKLFEWQWKCPHCNNYQSYNWNVQKPDETYAGMIWDKQYIDATSGSYDIEKTAATARMQCYHCTGSVADTYENRRYLNDTGKYVCIEDKGNPQTHTYTWCAFVNQKISFKEKVIQYLQAKDIHKKHGTTNELKTFTQQVLGKSWKRIQPIDISKVLVANFNNNEKWPEEVFRCMAVDYQQKFGLKHWIVVAYSTKEIRVLDHGTVSKWEEVDEISKKYNIPPKCVAVDTGYNAKEVYLEAFKRGSVMKIGNIVEIIGWCCLKGDDADDGYQHVGPNGSKVLKYYSPLRRPQIKENTTGRLYEWSNKLIKDTLYHIREGKGELKIVLPIKDDEFERQMHSETIVEVIDSKTGLKKSRWEKVHDDNHWWDCLCMAIVLCIMAGKFGEDPRKFESSNNEQSTKN